MSIVDTIEVVADSRNSITIGHFSYITLALPVFERVPKTVKLLDAHIDFPVPNTLNSSLINAFFGVGNNHVVIETDDGTTSVDIFIPELAASDRLPQANPYGIGPNPVATNAGLGTFISAIITALSTTGTTYTIATAADVTVGVRWTVTSDDPTEMIRFNTYDSLGLFLGFGYRDFALNDTDPNLITGGVAIAPIKAMDYTSAFLSERAAGRIEIHSTLIDGTENGVLKTDRIPESPHALFVVPLTDPDLNTGYYQPPVTLPAVDIESSHYAQSIRDKTATFEPDVISSETATNTHFWLRWPLYGPINNEPTITDSFWWIRFVIGFAETSGPSIRVV